LSSFSLTNQNNHATPLFLSHTRSQVYVLPYLVKPDGESLAKIAQFVDEGKLKVLVSKVLPLEKASEAHEELEKLSVRGKIVLKVSDE